MRTSQIRTWADALIRSFGKPRPAVTDSLLRTMHAEADFAGMLGHIKMSMRLNMRLRLGLVNSGGRQNMPAWVILPSPMPFYGSKDFQSLQITVFIRRSVIKEAPFESLVAVMAHELSHVLLDAVGHSLRRQEEAVDLTAMIFGYSRYFIHQQVHMEAIPRNGLLAKVHRSLTGNELVDHEVVSTVSRVGYLSFDEITYAQSLMK